MYIACNERISLAGICVNGARQEMHDVNSALLLRESKSLVCLWSCNGCL
jgi:hypothetical protein